jgi:hypothetical protein
MCMTTIPNSTPSLSGGKSIDSYIDKFVKSLSICHCEEQSDDAISCIQVLTLQEIASLRSQ